MYWQATNINNTKFKFIIEEDDGIGFYLYVYENNNCINDYLQDTLYDAKEMAFEDFGVPIANWKLKG